MWLIKSINGWLTRHQTCWQDFVKIFYITSNIKLFADDTLLYGLIHNSDDAISLQSDLDKFVEWAKLWQMAFNPSKCYALLLRVCRSKCPFIHPYTMLGHTLQAACRPLSLPRSFSVREPKLEATYPKHYKQSQFDTWLCQEELASLPTES